MVNKYWFRKRKGLLSGDLGWGWRPISWEGWLLTLGWIAGIYYTAIQTETGTPFWIVFIVSLIVFIIIADWKTQDKVLFK